MTRRHLVSLAVVLLAVAGSLAGQTRTIYVSPRGNDAWSGTLLSPNAGRTDGPVVSLERARDIARIMRPGAAAVSIIVRGGVYDRSQSFELTAADSGSAASPLKIAAYRGEQVSMRGSIPLTGWQRLEEQAPRLPESARGKVMVTDLASNGISAVPEILPRGAPPIELFFGSKRMTLARYPNSGWLHIADVPQSGDSLFNEGLARERRFDNVPVGRHYGRIRYAEDRPSSWSPDNSIIVQGFWTFDWSDTYQHVESINPAAKEIAIAPPHHNYGYTQCAGRAG
jgi:hypothetical protein